MEDPASPRIPGAPPAAYQEWATYGPQPLRGASRTRASGASHPNVPPPSSIYGGFELPIFGTQYGMPAPSREGHRAIEQSPSQPPQPTVMLVEAPISFEDRMREANAELERAYQEKLEPSSQSGASTEPTYVEQITSFLVLQLTFSQSNSLSPDDDSSQILLLQNSNSGARSQTPPQLSNEEEEPLALFIIPEGHPTECIICTEEFTSELRPPPWITLTCLHQPSVCTSCMQRSISSDLQNKLWNQIKCPECDSLLIYEDIQRLADAETFTRYVLAVLHLNWSQADISTVTKPSPSAAP